MSASPYFFLQSYNVENQKWEDLSLYKKSPNGPYSEIDIAPPNGRHDIFALLNIERSNNKFIVPTRFARIDDLSETLIGVLGEFTDETEIDEDDLNKIMRQLGVTVINLADLRVFILKNRFIYEDTSDDIKDRSYSENPLIDFYNKILSIIELTYDYDVEEDDIILSNYRLICWVSY